METYYAYIIAYQAIETALFLSALIGFARHRRGPELLETLGGALLFATVVLDWLVFRLPMLMHNHPHASGTLTLKLQVESGLTFAGLLLFTVGFLLEKVVRNRPHINSPSGASDADRDA